MPKTPEQRKKDVEYQLRLQHKKRDLVREYKAARGCQVCGERDWIVLELHHRNPDTKNDLLRNRRFRATGGREWRRLSFTALAEELEKCDVLCANCHRRETHRIRTAEKVLTG